jgi:hypothetical protein
MDDLRSSGDVIAGAIDGDDDDDDDDDFAANVGKAMAAIMKTRRHTPPFRPSFAKPLLMWFVSECLTITWWDGGGSGGSGDDADE